MNTLSVLKSENMRALTLKSAIKASNDFDKSVSYISEDVRAQPQLKTFPDDKLRKELMFISQVAGNPLQQPSGQTSWALQGNVRHTLNPPPTGLAPIVANHSVVTAW